MATRTQKVLTPDDVFDAASGGQKGLIPGSAEWRMQINNQAAQQSSVATLPQDDDDDEQTVVDRIRSLVGQQGVDSLRVKLYRKVPNQSKMEWCCDYGIAEFQSGEMTLIRQQWGAGDFQIRVIGSTGILMREDVSIAAMLNAPQIAQAPERASDMAEVLRLISEQNQQIVAALSQRPDSAQQMRDMFALASSMREAFGIGAQTAPAPAQDTMAVITGLVSAMKTMREVSAEFNPPAPAPDTDNPMAMLPAVLDLVKTGMQSRMSPQQLQQREAFQPITVPASMAGVAQIPGQVSDESQQIQNPQHNPQQQMIYEHPQQVQQQPAPQNDQETIAMMVLRGTFQKLLAMAAANESDDIGAEFIADKLPDEILPYIELPNWFEILTHFEPKCATYQEWLTRARDKAVILLNSPDDPA